MLSSTRTRRKKQFLVTSRDCYMRSNWAFLGGYLTHLDVADMSTNLLTNFLTNILTNFLFQDFFIKVFKTSYDYYCVLHHLCKSKIFNWLRWGVAEIFWFKNSLKPAEAEFHCMFSCYKFVQFYHVLWLLLCFVSFMQIQKFNWLRWGVAEIFRFKNSLKPVETISRCMFSC